MNIIKRILIVIAFFISSNSIAISTFNSGDTLYVWAQKGLQLRLEPSFNSEPIELIEFGERVIAIDSKELLWDGSRLEESYVIEIKSKKTQNRTYPNFRLNGNWCKVKFEGKEGYVFDAYLSTLKTINSGERCKTYFDKNFKVIDTILFKETKKGHYRGISRLVYDKGILYNGIRAENFGSETFILPYSFEEAYLIFVSNYINKNNPYYNLIESDSKRVFFSGEMDELTITKVNGYVIIEHEWGN